LTPGAAMFGLTDWSIDEVPRLEKPAMLPAES
jgi:hypothetical protein